MRWLLIALFLSACGHESKKGPHPRAAAYAADGFTYDKEQPKRSGNDFDFFYKRCSLMSQKLNNELTEYECSSP